jgi:hypothetical protein
MEPRSGGTLLTHSLLAVPSCHCQSRAQFYFFFGTPEEVAEKLGFGCVLYQGTASAGPESTTNIRALAPASPSSRRG